MREEKKTNEHKRQTIDTQYAEHERALCTQHNAAL